MRILIAEDDLVSRKLLEKVLKNDGHEVISAVDGKEAWEKFQNEDISFIISDWMMPEVSGPELCKRIRNEVDRGYVYVILLTAKTRVEDIIEGMQAGADDFVTKPFNQAELRVRIRAGQRIVELEKDLESKIDSLEDSLEQIRTLEGMLPICSICKNIRDDDNYWHQMEDYISRHTEAEFSHSICPTCYDKHYKDIVEKTGGR
jgi:phosphoserine phosphatase RsbU/P